MPEMPEVEVLAERLRLINPDLVVTEVQDFMDAGNVMDLLDAMDTPAGKLWAGAPLSCVVDGVDSLDDKAALLVAGTCPFRLLVQPQWRAASAG